MREERIDELVLALLYLGHWTERSYGSAQTWKSFDWSAMERLHTKGYISNPVGKAKSVTFSPEGFAMAKHAFDRLIGDEDDASAG